MFRNYLAVAFRFFWRQKTVSFINVFGLAVGVACALLIFQHIRNELSYDLHHEKASRIFRVLHADPNKISCQTVPPLAQTLVADFPEVVEATHVFHHWDIPLISDEKHGFYESRFFFVDEHFLSAFTLPLLRGNPETALLEPFTLLLTETAARRYFGNSDPIGERLKYNAEFEFTVTGIVADPPKTSHFVFDMLAAKPSLRDIMWSPDLMQSWSFGAMHTYIVLDDPASAENLRAKLPAFEARYHDPMQGEYLELQPLKAIHLHSAGITGEIVPQSDINYLYALAIIAALIVLIASINYINLTTARAGKRAKEVGLRKVIGASRSMLIRQFLGEGLLTVILVVAAAIGLLELLRPTFSHLVGNPLDIQYASDGAFWLVLLVLTLVVALLANGYPAFYCSAFQPADVLRRAGSTGKPGALLRRILVTGQFTISAILIICTFLIVQQVDFMRNKKLGFEKESLVVVPVRDKHLMQQFEQIKNTWEQHAGISRVAASSSLPGESTASTGVRWQGRQNEDPEIVNMYWVGLDYLATLGLELAGGRDFSREFGSDSESILINEELARRMGFAEPADAVGSSLDYWRQSRMIIGVVRDFHFYSLRDKVNPLVVQLQHPERGVLAVRLAGGDPRGALSHMQESWPLFSQDQPFSYSFLDQDLDQLYKAETRWAALIAASATLAVLVACLGLFGLATFVADQRTKEIGVRKVLGASLRSIVLLILREFTKLVLAGVVVAAPIAYWTMKSWLATFAYRIDIGVVPFAATALLSVILATLTISYQTLRAALTNPVDALKYE